MMLAWMGFGLAHRRLGKMSRVASWVMRSAFWVNEGMATGAKLVIGMGEAEGYTPKRS